MFFPNDMFNYFIIYKFKTKFLGPKLQYSYIILFENNYLFFCLFLKKKLINQKKKDSEKKRKINHKPNLKTRSTSFIRRMAVPTNQYYQHNTKIQTIFTHVLYKLIKFRLEKGAIC